MDSPNAPKRPAFKLASRATDLTRVIDTCEGCDDPSKDDLDLFAVLTEDMGWRVVVFCPTCAELAHENWTGATVEIRRVLPYDLFAPPEEEEGGAICPECSAVVGETSECSTLTHPMAFAHVEEEPDDGRESDLALAIERCADVADMASQEWHDALAVIQAILGQPDGSFASVFFAGLDPVKWSAATPERRGDTLARYVFEELRS